MVLLLVGLALPNPDFQPILRANERNPDTKERAMTEVLGNSGGVCGYSSSLGWIAHGVVGCGWCRSVCISG